MARRSRTGIGSWLLLSCAIILADQASKALVVDRFRLGERLTLVPGLFDFTLAYNKGAAFNFLAAAGGWQRWFFIGLGTVAALFILYLLMRHGGQRLFALALALILGGAIGNVIDRIFRGQVVDFLLAYYNGWYFPAFNVADSAITVGAVLLIVDELMRVRRSR